MKTSITLMLGVTFDPSKTTPEDIRVCLGQLLDTVTSTPGVLDEIGNPEIAEFDVHPTEWVEPEDEPGLPVPDGDNA